MWHQSCHVMRFSALAARTTRAVGASSSSATHASLPHTTPSFLLSRAFPARPSSLHAFSARRFCSGPAATPPPPSQGEGGETKKEERKVVRVIKGMAGEADRYVYEKDEEGEIPHESDSGVGMRFTTYQEQMVSGQHRNYETGKTDHDPATETIETSMNRLGAMLMTVALFSLGGTMLVVPIYKMYCSTAPVVAGDSRTEQLSTAFDAESNVPKTASVVNVLFRGSLGAQDDKVLFVPLQSSIDALVGEPTLAFFNVYNKTAKTLIGLSTYNVAPSDAAPYFNKIQCFCFEEQRIKPHELIEMPVFFFVEKEYLDDPATQQIRSILLNYTLFVL
eukprot:Rhum_TRINITY_DN17710_c0_g1::Rhum_TRINITY_DN17710_c0_g1_i1::g.166383::m.166383/K02258/COX11; cytochrome c oxidase assembly protein subunit 11